MSTDAKVAIAIFAIAMVGTLALGIAAVRGRDANLSEWSVGGRSFGVLLTWVLLAGECYTSFSYLGAAGWAYGYGAPIFYLVGYMATGYATVYLFAPMVWGYAKRHDLISVTDVIAHRFRSKRFGAFVAIVATVALLPYIQLQIQGMGLVVSAMSYGEIGLKSAFVIGFVVSVGFVLISGLRGSAWVSVLKDSLVILTIAFLAIYLPVKLFGGYGELFSRLRAERPEWLTLPGHESPGLGPLWFISTCILNGVTFTVFPSFVAGYLGSRSANTIRRNAIFLPLYSILLLVPVMLGMAALFVVAQPRDRRPRAAEHGHARAARVGRGHRRRRGRVERDRADGRLHALHRDDVGQERARRRRRRPPQAPVTDRRVPQRPGRAGGRAAVP